MELLNGKIRVDRSGGNPELLKFIFTKILSSDIQISRYQDTNLDISGSISPSRVRGEESRASGCLRSELV